MSVRLASQCLSESAACSLGFCLPKSLTEFQGCEATVKFLITFNILFDILNSKNLRASDGKCSMHDKNNLVYANFLNEARIFILAVTQVHSGTLLVESNGKTGLLGFIICIKSLLKIYDHLTVAQRFGISFLTDI